MENQNNNLNTQPTETVMKMKPSRNIWRIVSISFVVLLILFIGLVIYRLPVAEERLKTEATVEKIHAQKLTLADVMGQNLPPEPDPALKDATIEGIDVNGNGIRDDVELAIFKLHPDSARIRAAELQYAMALQNEMTSDVFNSGTLVGTIHKESRGFFCIGDAAPNQSPIILSKEVKNLVFDITTRIQRDQDVFKNYMTSNTEPSGPYCDIDLTSLSN
jgi:hypothetical protein